MQTSDDLDELPDDVGDSEKYLQIPDKRELDLGKPLALDFARQFLPKDFDEVRQLFSKRGAYARFKDLLDRRRALDQWYDFEAKAEERKTANRRQEVDALRRSPYVALFCLSNRKEGCDGQETIMFLLSYQFLPPSRKGYGPSFCG